MKQAKYRFVKQVEDIQEKIKASADDFKKWFPDPKGYFLIRVNHTKKLIEVGFVTYKHVIIKFIYGQNARDIYTTIIQRELVTRLEHAAYLGKELYKAEVALKYGTKYRQEFSLDIPCARVKVQLKKES
ncbi:DUF4346 domain-containing protein [Candidatus Woesearchaeota archaeon]|nr:DUF4346 domain-containing protein [Candidatus Woesearchaeota archaeon]